MGKNKQKYTRKKSMAMRIFIIFMAVAMLVGIIIIPIKSWAANEDSIIVESFQTGKLDEALREAADGTDYNYINNVAVLNGVLNSDDYNALTSIPNIIHLELAACETQDGIIPENALPSRNQLIYISLPKNTEVIGVRAFSNNKKLEKVSMPSSVKKIEAYAFEACEAMSDIPISENITYIGESAFRDCKAITSFIIPSSVTEIYSYTFSKCGFSEIYIGPNITSIGDGAFSDCNNLTDIYVYGENAPALSGQGVFQNVSASIHVYEDSKDDYKSWEYNNLKVQGNLTGEYVLMAIVPANNEEYYTETTAETKTDNDESVTETSMSKAEETIAVAKENTGISPVQVVLIAVGCIALGAGGTFAIIKFSKKKNS